MSDTQELPEPFSEKEIARLIHNLEETSYNEGSIDLSCRCADALIVIKQLQAALSANQQEPGDCEWKLEDDESGTWASACGQLWSFIDGGPKENRVSYCHHCSKKVYVAVPVKEGM